VWSCGDVRDGRLGQGLIVILHAGWPGASLPARMRLPAWCVGEGGDRVVALAAGGHHSLLVTTSGRLLVCGRGRHGALGLGDATDADVPIEVMLPMTRARCLCRSSGHMSCRAIQVAGGRDHSVVLTACGAVLCAGSNTHGQLGIGSTETALTFIRTALPRTVRPVAISAGDGNTAAVGADGSLWLWGRGEWGQLGDGEYRSRWLPAPLQGFRVVA